jgi:hypothetical protein
MLGLLGFFVCEKILIEKINKQKIKTVFFICKDLAIKKTKDILNLFLSGG